MGGGADSDREGGVGWGQIATEKVGEGADRQRQRRCVCVCGGGGVQRGSDREGGCR